MGHEIALALERRRQRNETAVVGGGGMLTPLVDEDYWAYRVQLAHGQAIVGFPKFSTVGIGFALEEDWNTNLPYRCHTDDIVSHVLHNKRFACIPDESVKAAVLMVQEAAVADLKDPRGGVGSLGRTVEVELPPEDDEEDSVVLEPCPDEKVGVTS